MKILFFNLKALVSYLFVFAGYNALAQFPQIVKEKKDSPYEQITFVDLLKKYMDKDASMPNNIEGIYSVSASAQKKSKPLFSSTEREKTIDQRDNYAVVAIVRDNSKNSREYIEVPIDRDNLFSYPVRGELTAASGGNILVLKHFEPKGKILTYTLAYDYEKDIVEGIRTETSGSVVRTYKIVYLKLYPKPQKTATGDQGHE
ncbi:MAG TPA: hypothetical protein VL728_12150 [Cyclobacteriaceae bacterium]|jgi:hypothetical protein|nr:hypothetical protein [Cyclobacteriaceae bacterium]